MESAIQQVIDKMAICEVHLRYCRGIDRVDIDLIRSCYHPDAVEDHGVYKGDVTGFLDFCESALAEFESTTHLTGNQLVNVTGDTAWAEHYTLGYHRLPATDDRPAIERTSYIRYADRMERRNGEWRIAERVVTIDAERDDLISDSPGRCEIKRSRRDRSDPSYVR